MAYQYPDKNDGLTVQLIDTEYDGVYWAKSEELVLRKAIDAVINLPEKDNKKRLLDLGCGKGRLIEVFADHVDRIVAVEPDASRFEEARKAAETVASKTSKDIQVINGTISALNDEAFDVILSSHVIQHITSDMTKDLFLSMATHLEEGGLLILTTTHTPLDQDQFFKEEWQDGKRISTPITSDEFDQCFDSSDVLPVRIFTRSSIENLADAANFSLEKICCYHYKNHTEASQDVEADGNGARDVMYIFRKKETLIDANIGYHFSFSIFDEETGLRTDDESELRVSIKKAYPGAIFYDSSEADKEPVFRDLKTGQGFLHGGGLPFNCFRVLLNDYKLQMNGFEIFDSGVMLTVFPETDTVQLSVSLSLKNARVDDLVYFRHVQGNGSLLTNHDGRSLSVNDIYREVSGCLERKIPDKEDTYLIEIKRFGDLEDVEQIIQNNCKKLYGIMTGDEGWRHVPEALARERLVNQWGSREFVRLISFGANSVLFNLSMCKAAVAYRENRRLFDAQFYGDMNPYFLIDSNFAGINHGVFFSIELVMVIKTICNRILSRQASFYHKKNLNVSRDIEKTKSYRGELLSTLNKVENLAISEIGEMEKVLLISQQIDPIIEKLKYLLELVESELDLLYQNSTNRLVNILTVLGLVLSAIGVCATIYSVL